MLKALRDCPVLVGTAQVLADAVRYIGIMLIVLLLLGQLARMRSERARVNSERAGERGSGPAAL